MEYKVIIYHIASQVHARIVSESGFTLDDTCLDKRIVNSLDQWQDVLKFIHNYQLKNGKANSIETV